MGRHVPAQAAPGILKGGKKTGLRAPCVVFQGFCLHPGEQEPHLGQPPGLQLPDEAVEPRDLLGHPRGFFRLGGLEGGVELGQPLQHRALLLVQQPPQPLELAPDAPSLGLARLLGKEAGGETSPRDRASPPDLIYFPPF